MEEIVEKQYVAWEKRKDLGIFRALWFSLREIMFHPGQFFEKLTGCNSFSGAFLFYISVVILYMFVQVFTSLTYGAPFEALPNFLLAGVVLILGMYIFTAIMHLFVMLFKGKGGYAGTFNVIAYSFAAWMFYLGIIQIISSLCFLGMEFFSVTMGLMMSFVLTLSVFIWLGIIMVIGYRKVHRLGLIKAVCAILIPFIIFTGSIVLSNWYGYNSLLKRLQSARSSAYEGSARAQCLMVSVACQIYFDEYKKYPRYLEELVKEEPPYINSDSPLLEADNSASLFEGYYYVYESVDDGHFTLYAYPGGGDGKTFFIDETGVLRFGGPEGEAVEND